ncbi:ATP-grasp domain-containing protein [Streptomyces sp. NPDC101132]|uniref:carboxylate--amine ligase n=1 Tax=Streptomyces sp. NPDC101132 TaxID=3366110 RepID=UPI003825AB21
MAVFATDVPAVLLRLDRNPFHHGTLGAVRSLGRQGVEVHAVVEADGGPVARSRHLRAAHPAPAGDPGPDALLACLTGVSERIGRPAVLFAMDDLGAITVSRIAPLLAGRYLLPSQPGELPARVADKAELAALCARWDVGHPETVVPASGAEAAEAAWRLGLPAVAKWSRPWLLPPDSGLRSTTLVTTAAEARRLYERTPEAGSPLLLQRFLPGGPDTDWFFHGAFARGGRPLLTGSGRKELSWPVRTGLTAVGRWLPDPAAEEAGLRLAARLGYQGILDLDFRRDERGRLRLLDFNPRPGAQFRLFTDTAGLDVVRAMYLDLTGQPVPERAGGPGRVFVAENYALLAALATRGAAPRRAGGRIEPAWFAADDPLPFLAMARAFLGRGLHKGGRRLWGALRGVPAGGRRTARAVVRVPRAFVRAAPRAFVRAPRAVVRAPRQRGGDPLPAPAHPLRAPGSAPAPAPSDTVRDRPERAPATR